MPAAADIPWPHALPASYTPVHLTSDILKGRAALQGERKHVTVLFCDLVNSTRLAEELGAEAMHHLLDLFFRAALAEVHRYEGTINQFLGDGFMALFGAPVAREKHADAAVRGALAILHGLQSVRGMLPPEVAPRLNVRIGINTGEVVVGSIGDDLRMDFTAVGDTTNIAARLQHQAAPGTILVAESTARLLRAVRLEPTEVLNLHGKTEPVPAYRVTGLRPDRSPGDDLAGSPLSPFLGRERELRLVMDLLARAEAGKGQAVGIVAEAGGGKSRLLLEFRRGLVGRRLTYLEADCVSYGSTVPWGAVLDILRRNSGIVDVDTPEEAASKVRLSLEELGLEPDEWAPCILYVLGIKEHVRALDGLAPEAVKQRIVEAVRRMTVQGSRRRPIVFVVEDCHWIDRTSEECFEALIDSIPDAAVLLICTYRPGYRPPWMDRSFATQVALPQLSEADSREILSACLGEVAHGRDLDAVVHRAAGNPLFLEELSRALQHPPGSGSTIPAGVRDVILSRIDHLPDQPKQLLHVAAVLGGQFSRGLLASVWESAAPLEPSLRRLIRLEFLNEHAGALESSLTFRHPVMQEVAYETLLAAPRRALHAAAARALERIHAGRLGEVAGLLAHHYARAEAHAKAIEYSMRAGDRAVATYALPEGLGFFRQALEHTERLPASDVDATTVAVALRLTHVLMLSGGLPDARDLLIPLEARVARLGDPVVIGQYHSWLGLVWSLLGDRRRASDHARRALSAAEASGDINTTGRAEYVLAAEQFWLGRLQDAVEHGARAAAALRQAGDMWWLGLAHWISGISLGIQGRFAEAFDTLARFDALGRETADRRLTSMAAWSTGILLAFTGAHEASIAQCLDALQKSPDPLTSAFAEGAFGYSYFEAGRAAEARGKLETAAQMMTFFGFEPMAAWFTVGAGEACLALGDLGGARELIQSGIDRARAVQFWPAVGWGERARGRLAAAEGRADDAVAEFATAVRTFTGFGARFEAARTRLAMAEVHVGRADTAQALAALDDATQAFTLCDTPIYHERAQRLRARVAGGEAGLAPV